ncbi:hypothetical protein [Vibrio sp. SCSIO 43136]|uniref:hypothetical protein n=1 Tax=Vibrio sp. SCSIO 43136 TaxID=2819101 RepID=UPI002075F4A6|nr:hypothetical protein [Vibrio sp. SCSIO 43136]USD67407.1 hypothetical protein J4N39_22535 [Vibrio sp. SCSIO 43136]
MNVIKTSKQLLPIALLSALTGCGGGGGESDSAVPLSERSAAVAANSLETLELPMAMSNLATSLLHQLDLQPGTISGTCLLQYNGRYGTYSAEFSGSELSITIDNCTNHPYEEMVTGRVKLTFSKLSQQGQYLEFDSKIEAELVQDNAVSGLYNIDYVAQVSQAIEANHQVKTSMTLGEEETIYVDHIPIHFVNGSIERHLDYMTGHYSATAYANITAPDLFEGTLSLRTSSPLEGKIMSYPSSGKYTIYSDKGGYAAVSASSGYWAKIEASGTSQTVDVFWSNMTSGAILAFPARQGISSGEFSSPSNYPKIYSNQSTQMVMASDTPLRPTQTILMIPAPAIGIKDKSYLRNTSSYETVPKEDYQLEVDGPWITFTMLKDLPVDDRFGLSFVDNEDRHVGTIYIETQKAPLEVTVTADQVLTDLSTFTLKATKVGDSSQSFSIDWTQVAGINTLDLTKINSTEASFEPSQMTPGEIYTFLADITDVYGRKTKANVFLMREDPVKGSSYISYQTDEKWFNQPNTSKMKVIETRAQFDGSKLEINSTTSDWNNNFSLGAEGVHNGYIYIDDFTNKNHFLYFNLDGWSMLYNCTSKSMQMDVIEHEVITEPTYPFEYHKLAIDFTLRCEDGSMTGKIRSNSQIP